MKLYSIIFRVAWPIHKKDINAFPQNFVLIRLLEKRRSNLNTNINLNSTQNPIIETPFTSRKKNLQEEKSIDKEKINEQKETFLELEHFQDQMDTIESVHERKGSFNGKKDQSNDLKENLVNINVSSLPFAIKTHDTIMEPNLCKEHHRRLEIVCIDHRCRICTNCALFGSHKNHEIKTEEEVYKEVGQRAESLIDIFSLIEMNQNKLFDEKFVDNLNSNLKNKYDELAKIISEKFNVSKLFSKNFLIS